MNLPYGFIFENQSSAFLKLIAQPMFLVGSGIEGHDRTPELCDVSEWLDGGRASSSFRVNEESWTLDDSPLARMLSQLAKHPHYAQNACDDPKPQYVLSSADA
jgi:hypothetical protein